MPKKIDTLAPMEIKEDVKQILKSRIQDLHKEVDEDTDIVIFNKSCKNAINFINSCDFTKITFSDKLPFITFDTDGYIVWHWKNVGIYLSVVLIFKRRDKVSISCITKNRSRDLFFGTLEDAIYRLERL